MKDANLNGQSGDQIEVPEQDTQTDAAVTKPKRKRKVRRKISDDEFECVAGQLLEGFLEDLKFNPKGLDEDIELVFNDDELIRRFAIYCIAQLNTFINYPEELTIRGH